MVFDRSFAASYDHVKVSNADLVQLLEDGLDDWFQLEGVVAVVHYDREHFFRYLFREGQHSRANSTSRNDRFVLAEPVDVIVFSPRL